jgi:hypothetical protein
MPQASLGDATRRAIVAAAEGDLEEVGRALADRAAAMATATPQERADALEEGETIGRLIAELKRNIVAEHSRLEQVRAGFAKQSKAPAIDVKA